MYIIKYVTVFIYIYLSEAVAFVLAMLALEIRVEEDLKDWMQLVWEPGENLAD